jgi:hypothetical protein
MIFLLDTSPKQGIKNCGDELKVGVGQLLTPLTRYRLQHPELPWAIDNGAFSGFNEKAFTALLKREHHHRGNCKFVCAPDVVADHGKTIALFNEWKDKLKDWPIAFVLQDGLKISEVPWNEISAVFVGGSNRFKGSFVLWECLKAAKAMGKWVHIGRVNNGNRYNYFQDIADSCDGTGVSRYTHMRQGISNRHNQERLFA